MTRPDSNPSTRLDGCVSRDAYLAEIRRGDELEAELEQAKRERDEAKLWYRNEDLKTKELTARLANLSKRSDALVVALRTARTWLARPSDVEAQHAKTLIRATHEIDDALTVWEQE